MHRIICVSYHPVPFCANFSGNLIAFFFDKINVLNIAKFFPNRNILRNFPFNLATIFLHQIYLVSLNIPKVFAFGGFSAEVMKCRVDVGISVSQKIEQF